MVVGDSHSQIKPAELFFCLFVFKYNNPNILLFKAYY